MSQEAQIMFIKGLKELAKLTRSELSDWSMEAYNSVFNNRWDDGIKALKLAFMRIKPQHGMPSPYDLLSLLGEVAPAAPTSRDRGNDTANRILGAISEFGGYRPVEAKESLGGDIWRVVEAMGGWGTLCMIEIDDLTTWRAQIRDAAEGFNKNDYFGGLQLDQSKQIKELIEGQKTGMSLQ